MTIRHVGAIALGIVVLTTLIAPAASRGQAQGSIDALLAALPAGARDWSVRQLTQNGERFVYLRYTVPGLVESPGLSPQEMPALRDREYHEIYHWDGAWRRVFNLYDVASRLLDPVTLGPVVEGRPQPATALLHARLYPAAAVPGLGDVLVLAVHAYLGPGGFEHSFPEVAVLFWNGTTWLIIWTGLFEVRGGIVSVEPGQDGLRIIADAYLDQDPFCCPTGWESVLLVPHTMPPYLVTRE